MKNLVKIGEGVYGEVFRAQRARNQHVALKVRGQGHGSVLVRGHTSQGTPALSWNQKCKSQAWICLCGFNVAFKHLRSYHDGACL